MQGYVSPMLGAGLCVPLAIPQRECGKWHQNAHSDGYPNKDAALRGSLA